MNVLISEVAGPARWGQFNLKLAWVPTFFGASLGAVHSIHLAQIDANGNFLANHHMPEIYKPNSSNWAFEIPGASALTFPGKHKRPILILSQTAAGYYPFELVMPSETPYNAVAAFLAANRQTPLREMARCIVDRSMIPANRFGLHF
ncbi:MAG: hypothetical protein JJ864_04805 [Rhizobiaceae bacterium]|nr:hypothetical protein [Rhizobiaceae bacterium]